MNLNLSIISERLSAHYQLALYGMPEHGLYCGLPRFFRPGSAMKANSLYLAAAKQLPAEPVAGAYVICAGEALPSAWTHSEGQVLHIRDCLSVEELSNEILNIFSWYDDLEALIRDELEKTGSIDLQQILSVCAQITGHSVSVCDAMCFPQAVCTNRNGQLFVKSCPHESGSFITDQYWIRVQSNCNTEQKIKEPYLSEAEHAGRRLYCYNFYYMDHFMWVATFHSESKPFQDYEFPLMDYLFRYIKSAFLRYLSEQNQIMPPLLKLLRSLMNDESADTGVLSDSINSRWICFKIRKQQMRKSLPKNYMRACVNSLAPDRFFAWSTTEN